MAAPLATARFVSVWATGSFPVTSLTKAGTCGIMVEPPQRRTSSMSDILMSRSESSLFMTSLVASRRCLVLASNSSLVIE